MRQLPAVDHRFRLLDPVAQCFQQAPVSATAARCSGSTAVPSGERVAYPMRNEPGAAASEKGGAGGAGATGSDPRAASSIAALSRTLREITR